MFAALGVIPALPGARCRGRSHLFDGGRLGEDVDVLHARHRQALALCAGCPALERCAEWLDALPRRERPLGVIAGRRYTTAGLASSLNGTGALDPEGQP